MSRLIAFSVIVHVIAAVGRVTAAIPEPDAVLYGTARIRGVPVVQRNDVMIVARLGSGQEIGRYNFADCNNDGVRDTCELSCANPGCSGVTGCGTGRDTNPADGLLDDCPGNLYVLKIRSESVPSGLTASGNAAVLNPANPTVVRVFIQQAEMVERFVRNFLISERGKIRNIAVTALSLFAHAGLADCVAGPATPSKGGSCSTEEFNAADYDEDGDVDLRDYAFVQNHFVPE